MRTRGGGGTRRPRPRLVGGGGGCRAALGRTCAWATPVLAVVARRSKAWWSRPLRRRPWPSKQLLIASRPLKFEVCSAEEGATVFRGMCRFSRAGPLTLCLRRKSIVGLRRKLCRADRK